MPDSEPCLPLVPDNNTAVSFKSFAQLSPTKEATARRSRRSNIPPALHIPSPPPDLPLAELNLIRQALDTERHALRTERQKRKAPPSTPTPRSPISPLFLNPTRSEYFSPALARKPSTPARKKVAAARLDTIARIDNSDTTITSSEAATACLPPAVDVDVDVAVDAMEPGSPRGAERERSPLKDALLDNGDDKLYPDLTPPEYAAAAFEHRAASDTAVPVAYPAAEEIELLPLSPDVSVHRGSHWRGKASAAAATATKKKEKKNEKKKQRCARYYDDDVLEGSVGGSVTGGSPTRCLMR
ncbi:hypothetical protein LTS18_002115 [Coniosporium uncinatum]|uniref:Uncharacterized protein n=1 Tax=Coniosporium uncinatum TaxID=93489 RepID=A0ACC3DUD7_9PEZI|nr:hypothetical protein LTS18_002115 [Coniosporium uncinatum]